MIKSLALFRFIVGTLMICLGIYGLTWWIRILKDSGGPDQDSGIIMVVPNFIAMFVVIIGLVFLCQGILRIFKKF